MPGFNKELCETLKKPLTPHQRRGPGGSYTYFKGSDVVSRLNEAFGHCWSSERLEEKVVEGHVLMLVSITVQLEADTIVHHGYGSAEIARNKDKAIINIGNSYKSAFTTALKKAAEQFGIGLEEEEDEVAPAPTGSPKGPAGVNKPATTTMSRPSTPTGRPQMTAPQTMGGAPKKPAVSVQAEPVSLPKAKAPAVSFSGATPGDDFLNAAISDTQRMALSKLAEMKGKKEADLIKGAGLNKGGFSELTRNEAIEVIKHANTLPQG